MSVSGAHKACFVSQPHADLQHPSLSLRVNYVGALSVAGASPRRESLT